MATIGELALTRMERLCERAASPQELTEVVGRAVASAVGADAHVFLVLDPLSGLWTAGCQAGYPENSCQLHREYAFLRSPYADYAAVSRAKDRVVRLNRRAHPRGDAYVELFLHAHGYEEELHVSFASAGQGLGHLTLSLRDGCFDARARKLVEAMVAPVTRHLRRLVARELVESIPGEHLALLFVDTAGKLTPANAAGAELLRSIGAPSAIFTSPLGVAAELARRSILGPVDAAPPRLAFVAPSTNRRYRLLIEPMLPVSGEARALLVAEPIRSLDSVELLRKVGLTEREADVALAALRGFRSAEGAEILKMSEHTFLGHLKATYKKLGVGSRAELAAMVLGG